MGLTLAHLSVRFGGLAAVDDVSLAVDTGRVLAVLGPSGCGKSTLLRTVAGLEPAYDGEVCLDSVDLRPVPAHRRGFALMFQDGQLFAHQNVGRNVGYPLRLRRRPRAEVSDRVAELLGLVGLAGYQDRRPDTLSGGERQRVALARALAARPRLLLLDEPLTALDSGLRTRLAGDLSAILTASGTTALWVTHDHQEAFAVADGVAVMRTGRIVQSGSVSEVWREPVDAWAARFLGYPTVLEGDAARSWAEVAGIPTAPAYAIRRGALRLSPAGALRGEVCASRGTPERDLVTVTLPGIGPVEAVAPAGASPALGAVVGVEVDADGVSRIGPE